MKRVRSHEIVQEHADWTFGSSLLDGVEALGENLRTRLLSWKGDCFWAQQEGIDWHNILGSANVPVDRLKQDIYGVVMKSDGVVQLTNLSVWIDRDKKLHIGIIAQVEIDGKKELVQVNV